MANQQWKTDITSTPEDIPKATLQDKIKEHIDNLFNAFKGVIWLLVFLIFVIAFLSFFSSERVKRAGDAFRAGSDEYEAFLSEEKDIEATEEELYLREPLMNLMNRMTNGKFDMDRLDARAFGAALFPASSEIRFRSVSFNRESNTVTIRYDQSVNRKVVLTFQGSNVTKVVTKYNGFSGGNVFGFLWWHTYVKFFGGYPRYTYTAVVPDDYPIIGQYNEAITRDVLYRQMLSRLRRLFGGD